MITAIRKAYGGGFRAGMAEPRIQRPGGTRGIKRIIEPSNPHRGLLGIAWELGRHDGLMKRLTTDYRGQRA